jgi:hypothetical protein
MGRWAKRQARAATVHAWATGEPGPEDWSVAGGAGGLTFNLGAAGYPPGVSRWQPSYRLLGETVWNNAGPTTSTNPSYGVAPPGVYECRCRWFGVPTTPMSEWGRVKTALVS